MTKNEYGSISMKNENVAASPRILFAEYEFGTRKCGTPCQTGYVTLRSKSLDTH